MLKRPKARVTKEWNRTPELRSSGTGNPRGGAADEGLGLVPPGVQY